MGLRSMSCRNHRYQGLPQQSSSERSRGHARLPFKPTFTLSGQGCPEVCSKQMAPAEEPKEADTPVSDELVRQVSSCVTCAFKRNKMSP